MAEWKLFVKEKCSLNDCEKIENSPTFKMFFGSKYYVLFNFPNIFFPWTNFFLSYLKGYLYRTL